VLVAGFLMICGVKNYQPEFIMHFLPIYPSYTHKQHSLYSTSDLAEIWKESVGNQGDSTGSE